MTVKMKIFYEEMDLKPVLCICCEKELNNKTYRLFAENGFDTGYLCGDCLEYLDSILQDLGFDIVDVPDK